MGRNLEELAAQFKSLLTGYRLRNKADPREVTLREQSAVPISRAPISRAPRPITPLGNSWVPPPPQPTAPPDHLPPYYPHSLVSHTDLIICKAVAKFPSQTQVVDLCKYIITELRPHFRRAISENLLRQDVALDTMRKLLECLLVRNCGSSPRRRELEEELQRSQEWLRLAETIARSRPNRSSPKGSKRKPSQESQRMTEATRSIHALWKEHPTAQHKDIIRFADSKKIAVPWSDCPSWNNAWAKRERLFFLRRSTQLPDQSSFQKRVSETSEFPGNTEKHPSNRPFHVPFARNVSRKRPMLASD